jgi:hypothetical protein
MHVYKRLAEDMNATTEEQYPSSEQMTQLGKLLMERNIHGFEVQRAIDNGSVCDQLADILRIIRIPSTDISSPLDPAAIRRVVNYLFNFDVTKSKSFDKEKVAWYAETSTGYDPVWLYQEKYFRKLLEGMDSNCLTILVLRKGLLTGNEVPTGILAERFKIPAKDITSLLQRANKHMKSQQAEQLPFFWKRKFWYEYELYTDDASLKSELISEYFRERPDGFDAPGARERILDAGINTVGELVALPRRQAAELLLGPDVYLPLEHFPRYVHVS